MHYLVESLKSIKKYVLKGKPEEPPPQHEITRFRYYVELGCDVLSWKDISRTLQVFIAFHFAFWFAIQLEVKFLGVLFTLALVVFAVDSLVEYHHPENILRPFPEEELPVDVGELVQNLKDYRRDHPVSFCLAFALFFFLLNSLAYKLSQPLLVYLVFLGTFLGPLTWKHLPEDVKVAIRQSLSKLNSQAVLAEEELFPSLTQDQLDSPDVDRESMQTGDSLTNSLTTDIGAMPSHLEVHDDVLMGTPSFTPTGLSSDSDSESDSHKEIYFHSRHFNGSGTPDDDDASGTKEVPEVPPTGEGISGLLQRGTDLVTNVVNRALQQPSPQLQRTLSSSSESEFEMIEGDFDIDRSS